MGTTEPSELRARCQCGEDLWAHRGGEWTLRARILRLVGGQFVARCPRCRSAVRVPWLAVQEAEEASDEEGGRKRRRAVVRRRRVDGSPPDR